MGLLVAGQPGQRQRRGEGSAGSALRFPLCKLLLQDRKKRKEREEHLEMGHSMGWAGVFTKGKIQGAMLQVASERLMPPSVSRAVTQLDSEQNLVQ